MRWQLTGETNRTYVVEGSTNLVGWYSIINVQPAARTAEFTDSTASALRFRFYRTVVVP